MALGEVSGDWGGGSAIGQAGLAAAVRAWDGRGPATLLRQTVPAHFGVASPGSLTVAMYRGRIPWHRHREIAPLVFAAAAAGDPVAREIVDRQADEIVAWATAAIRRVRLGRLDPDVVLAGGVFRAEDPAFYARIEAGVRAAAPRARLVRLGDAAGRGRGADRAGPAARRRQRRHDVEARLRAELTDRTADGLIGQAACSTSPLTRATGGAPLGRSAAGRRRRGGRGGSRSRCGTGGPGARAASASMTAPATPPSGRHGEEGADRRGAGDDAAERAPRDGSEPERRREHALRRGREPPGARAAMNPTLAGNSSPYPRPSSGAIATSRPASGEAAASAARLA